MACTANNNVAEKGLGQILAERGQIDEAIAHYQRAVEIKPNYAEAHLNLGALLAGRGELDAATDHYHKALEFKPDFADAHTNLGNVLARRGQVDEAVAEYRRALDIDPDFVLAHNNFGSLLARRGHRDEAITHFRRAVEIEPENADAHYNLGNALACRGEFDEALAEYEKALEIQPKKAAALNDLAWIRATHFDSKFRDGPQAVSLARRALELSPGDANCLATLAAAYAEAGRFAEAVQAARQAIDLARQQRTPALAESLQAKLRLYGAGRPFHESPPAPVRGPQR